MPTRSDRVSAVQRRFAYERLADAPLIVDAVYEGAQFGDVRDDPLARLVGGGNQGGFRYLGRPKPSSVRQCVLYTDMSDPEWPDRLDVETRRFTYFGDNKTPGKDLHDTQRRGNLILRDLFERAHTRQRATVPPVFVFTKGERGRDVVFRGLAVPGAENVTSSDDLVALWRTLAGQRFQNYRALFTVLDVPSVTREWLNDIRAGASSSASAPDAWRRWCEGEAPKALLAPRSRVYRRPSEQLPKAESDLELLRAIVAYYDEHDNGRYAFERCAAALFRLMEPSVISVDLTRPWRDGGRDALGLFRIGAGPAGIQVEFALEAKCKTPASGNSSGVRETARLVARIRHRQFGVLVTTSCVGDQAYQELIEDGHPVLVLAGIDIVNLLRTHGYSTPHSVRNWLDALESA